VAVARDGLDARLVDIPDPARAHLPIRTAIRRLVDRVCR
jgi:hypothetical protein